MTIVIRCFKHDGTYKPNYNKERVIHVWGRNAAECMDKVGTHRLIHDMSKETPWEIINVFDD